MVKLERVFLGLVFLLILCGGFSVQAQGAGSHFFDQTGHNVSGVFWDYYQHTEHAEQLLGYPITEEFVNGDGVRMQYFQRARLELRGGQVYKTDLGYKTYQQGIQLNISNPLACDKFDTGFSVCFAFLDFFKTYGGVVFFGNPISPFEYQNGRIVQYFEYGRLEWSGEQVVLSDLGTIYFQMAGEDPALLDSVLPLNAGTTTEVLSLNVRAFPWKAVTYSTDDQMVFVVVQNQTSQPVNGAKGVATIYWTDGTVDTIPIVTDAKGISTLVLPVGNQNPGGLVTIDARVQHGNLVGETTTSFRIWY